MRAGHDDIADGRDHASARSVIALRDVSKDYHPLLGRTVRAVRELSLDVAAGEVLGLAGPNGAGKSTIIALLLGYLRPTSGSVWIRDRAPREYIERHGIGYMAELVAIPPTWTLESALVRYALLAGVPDAVLSQRVDQVIAKLGLDEHRGKRVKQLSKGNAQRLGLAQLLLREESVVILDEPTHGLDPLWTHNFRELVRELRRDDRAILIASHNLDELERVADRVAIIDRGRLQRVVSVRAPRDGGAATLPVRYRLVLDSGIEHARALLPEAREIAPTELELEVRGLHELNDLLAALIARGALVRAVTPAFSSLERQFREAVRESVQ